MKRDIHPEYREVVFVDTSSDFKFLTRSTIETSETIEWEDGNTYPMARVEISSASHPFYTGKQILVDSGGRVERFRRRYGRESFTRDEAAASAPEETAPPSEEAATEEVAAPDADA
jgi:large subunit ribosomal protein L31